MDTSGSVGIIQPMDLSMFAIRNRDQRNLELMKSELRKVLI